MLSTWRHNAPLYCTVQKYRQHKLDLLADLVEAGLDDVDLVVLGPEDETRDVVLQFEALKHNALLYARDGFDRGG